MMSAPRFHRQSIHILLGIAALFVCFGALPNIAKAAALGTETIKFSPEIPLPGVFDKTVEVTNTLMANYVKAVFVYFIWIVGVVAVVMVIYGGIRWVAAAGNSSQIKEARDIVDNAIIGVLIALGSVVLLNVINPRLTHLSLPGVTPVAKQVADGLLGATHVCTGDEIDAIPSGHSQNCGTFFDLTKDITIDKTSHLPASSGLTTKDRCITTSCNHLTEVCVLSKDDTKQVFTQGTCATTVPLQATTAARYQGLTMLSVQNSQGVTSATFCGGLVGTTGGTVGAECLGHIGSCYVTDTPVSIISATSSNGIDRAANFSCPK